MAGRYVSAYMQLVWAVKFRQGLILEEYREEVQRIMCYWFAEHKHQVIAIYCMPDHVHILFKYSPTQAISQLVQVVKTESTKFIKRQYKVSTMKWQGGYALFTYSSEAIPNVKAYILNQAEHHKIKQSFVEEVAEALIVADEDFEEEYFFHLPI